MPQIFAQNLSENHLGRVNFLSTQPQIFKIPGNTSADFLYLRAEGADGGKRYNDDLKIDYAAGGAGATIKAIFPIGTGAGEIPPGSDICMVIGHEGASRASIHMNGAGGGGGTGVLFRKPNSTEWVLLVVAGAGGGAAAAGATNQEQGDAANIETYGSLNGGNNGEAGGQGGGDTNMSGFGGGGIYTSAADTYGGQAGWSKDKTVTPAGGAGGAHEHESLPEIILTSGGWGFGGGGSGCQSGGGGGGYSGGGGGYYTHDLFTNNGHGGGGGGSYVNETLALPGSISKTKNGSTFTPGSGFVEYELGRYPQIKLANDPSKCINLTGGNVGNGANIQLWSCNGAATQSWHFNGSAVHYSQALSKCIDLSNGNTSNGTNIQLWDCQADNKNQSWIYDVANQNIRSSLNFNKCMDLDHSNTADGTNIRLWDCNNTGAQKWLPEGVPSALPTGSNNSIRLAMASGKCVDISKSGTANGTNIQLYDCNGTNAQHFLFDGRAIKMQSSPNKCLDLNQSGTGNGTNIQLFDCNGTKAQQWIYDGFTKAFRSAVNTNKCIDVNQSNTANGANIQLWDCNGTFAQQFVIGQ